MARSLLKRNDVLSLPFIACGIWLYFYGYMALVCAIQLSALMPTWTMELGEAVALFSLLGLLAGWYHPQKSPPGTNQGEVSPKMCERIWRIGLFLLLVAIVGQYTFFGHANIDYKNISSYWYLMFYVGYPAAALCILSIARGAPRRRLRRILLLGGLIVVLMWFHILNARRGPLLPMVIVLAYVPYLVAGKKPRRAVVATSLAVGGLVMLIFVWIRPYSYAPGGAVEWTIADQLNGWRVGLRHLSLDAVLGERQRTASDNEFLYHCGSIGTVWELGDYQYGTGYLELFVHWVPRQLWPGKPGLQEGFFPGHWMEEMPNVMGWRMSTGSSSGGVANTFEQFGVLCPLFWCGIGWWAARLYRESTRQRNLTRSFQYVGLLCAMHWLIAQGFGAMFVPACYCIVIPTVVLAYVRRQGRVRIVHHRQGALGLRRALPVTSRKFSDLSA